MNHFVAQGSTNPECQVSVAPSIFWSIILKIFY